MENFIGHQVTARHTIDDSKGGVSTKEATHPLGTILRNEIKLASNISLQADERGNVKMVLDLNSMPSDIVKVNGTSFSPSAVQEKTQSFALGVGAPVEIEWRDAQGKNNRLTIELKQPSGLEQLAIESASIKPLFHGSAVSGISQFRPSEMGSMGLGLYMSRDMETARGYARRADGPGTSCLYECELENVRLFDVGRANELYQNDADFKSLFTDALSELARNPATKPEEAKEAMELVEQIKSNKALDPWTTTNFGIPVRAFALLGFDGIAHYGEWVIYNTEKVKVLKEEEVQRLPAPAPA